jgi:hypothetical protein
MSSVLAGVGAALAVMGVAQVYTARARRRSPRARRRATGPTTAVHLPNDDPHWLEYSERLQAEPEEKRAKRTARAHRRRQFVAGWTAGAVGDTYTDASGGCGGGGCGGG